MGISEATVKKYITSLLVASPVVLSMRQLDKEYRNTIGEEVPYRLFGCNSFEHFLHSIPDTVQVRGTGPMAEVIPIISEKSAHVNQLVTSQRVVKPRGNQFRSRKRPKALLPPDYRTTPPRRNESGPSHGNNYCPFKNDTSSTSSQFVSVPSNPNLPNKLQNHSGVTYDETRITREKETCEEKPIVNSSSGSNAKWLMNKHKNVTNDYHETSREIENKIPIQIRNNLRTLIQNCPEGIWCAHIPEKYRSMFRKELNYQDLGFKSLIHLCVCLSSIFHYVRPSTEDYKLYDRSRPLPDCVEKTYTMASFDKNRNSSEGQVNALPNIDWMDLKKFLPENIFMPGKEIPRAFVPLSVKKNDSINVVVGEIYDLSKFWVYLDDSLLDKLMDDMQNFYKEHARHYAIPNHLIKEGIYCAQVIFGEYHRALIVDRMPELEDTVRVIFIDYGTMTKVPTKGLCFLHQKFSELKAQAIRCRLTNVFPLEEGAPWSREACKAFRRLVADRDMTAKLSDICREEQYLEVYLADVTDPNDIFYVNDKLVDEGFAQHPNKELKQSQIDPIYAPIVKYLHLFPTFLELEHGLAPSTAEMEIFLEFNLPVNFCYPQYFYIDHTDEERVIKAAEEFHEKHCIKGKRRMPFSQKMDLDKYRAGEMDLSIFGDLQPEIMDMLKSKSGSEEPPVDVEEEFVDAVEEEIPEEKFHDEGGWDTIVERLEINVKEEETVNVLRQDLIVTEDIIKNIGEVNSVQSGSDGPPGCNLTEQLPQNCPTSDLSNENSSTQVEELWINQTGDEINCTVVNKQLEVLNGAGCQGDDSNHPLTSITLMGSCSPDGSNISSISSEQNDPACDLQPPDFHLNDIQFEFAPENNPMSIMNRFKTETENMIQDFLKQELYLDYSVDGCPVDIKEEPETEGLPYSSTNPFLNDLINPVHVKEEIPTLDPNNPFLTYNQSRTSTNSEKSSYSSSSTVYDSPIVKTQHSWSSFSDISANTIGQLGKSMGSNSSSSNSLHVFDDRHSCSTQTSEHKSVAVQVSPNPVPANSYGYASAVFPYSPNFHPAWSMGYNSNPHYSVRFTNFHMYESQFNPQPPHPQMGPPGIGPPPGFFPAPRFPMGGYGPPPLNYPHGGYGPQMPVYFDPQHQVRPNMNFPQNGRIYQGQRVEMAPPVAASSCVSNLNPTKDFYEVYNEQLQEKLSGTVSQQ